MNDHDDIAYGIVEDMLYEGVEYLTIVEATGDNWEGDDEPTDEDFEQVATEVQKCLDKLKERL